MTVTILIIFFCTQVCAHAFFKFGALHASHWLACFIGGNVSCAIGVWLLMQLYQRMSADLVLCVTVGGSFLLVQGMLALAFHTRPTPLQWSGMAAMILAMLVVILGGRPEEEEFSTQTAPAHQAEARLIPKLDAPASEGAATGFRLEAESAVRPAR